MSWKRKLIFYCYRELKTSIVVLQDKNENIVEWDMYDHSMAIDSFKQCIEILFNNEFILIEKLNQQVSDGNFEGLVKVAQDNDILVEENIIDNIIYNSLLDYLEKNDRLHRSI